MEPALAIIGGTGLVDFMPGAATCVVATPFGEVPVRRGRLGETAVAFLSRHGAGHARLPHEVDYRANIWAARELGAARILSTVACGSLDAALPPGSLALLDDFLDFTKSRVQTFRGTPGLPDSAAFYHVDLQPPYCPALQATLSRAAAGCGHPDLRRVTYACMEGPRYESPAEIRMLGRLGAEVVGMTGLPEAVLARELGLCYASVAIMTNAACGLSDVPMEHADVEREVAGAMDRVAGLLTAAAAGLPTAPALCCPAATRRARWFAGGDRRERTIPPEAAPGGGGVQG